MFMKGAERVDRVLPIQTLQIPSSALPLVDKKRRLIELAGMNASAICDFEWMPIQMLLRDNAICGGGVPTVI